MIEENGKRTLFSKTISNRVLFTNLGLFGFALVIIAITSIVFMAFVEIHAWHDRQNETALRGSEYVDYLFEETDNLLEYYFLLYRSQYTNPYHKSDISLSTNMYPLMERAFLNTHGNILYSDYLDYSLLFQKDDPSTEEWFQKTVENGIYLSAIQFNQNDKPYIIYSKYVNGYVLTSRVDFSMIQESVNSFQNDNKGTSYFIDQNNIIIAHPNDELIGQESLTSQLDQQEFVMHLTGFENSYVYINHERDLIFSNRMLLNNGWQMISETPIENVFPITANSSLFILILFSLTGIVFSLMFIKLSNKYFLKPLKSLYQGVTRIGDGDLDYRLDIPGDNEISHVANAINQMAEKLGTREIELASRTKRLIEEVNERKRAEEQLKYDAFHDSLTDLPNRSLLMDRLDRAVKLRETHSDYHFAILYLDIDRFKVVNDSLGHRAGDLVLLDVANRIENCIRSQDTLARLGGDEFVILAEDIKNSSSVFQMAERILNLMENPFDIWGHSIILSASIGIVLSTNAKQKADDYMRDADIAMYQAKAKGKAQYYLFSEDLRDNVINKLSLESDLRKATNNNEFVLHFQPITYLEDESTIGFEALLRWNHPKLGMLYPDKFIQIAEETGLILSIGKWVIREACQKLLYWNEKYNLQKNLKISINLSGKQIEDPSFPDELETILINSKINGNQINLEVTENAIIKDIDLARQVFMRLKELGVSIHMDDFGTGYSSLSYLRYFPIDVIKIDRSFVDRITVEKEQESLINTIINMSASLGLDVIAEGIETIQQKLMLIDLGCRYGQGFLFSRPLDEAGVERMLKLNSAQLTQNHN